MFLKEVLQDFCILLYMIKSSKSFWRRKWQPTPVFLPRESHGQRSLVGCCPYIGAHSRTWLKSLSMHAWIGEGNGNPLQCSCLENPRDRGAWWAAIHGVTQSRTWLKRLSSSSSSSESFNVFKKSLTLWKKKKSPLKNRKFYSNFQIHFSIEWRKMWQ